MSELTLADWHRQHGAQGFIDHLGTRVPTGYGDVEAEVHRLSEGAALCDRSYTTRLEIRGADRLRFLNGLVTCAVAELQPGAGAYGYLTSAKGRVLSDFVLLVLEDRLWLELPPGRGPEIREHLGRYIVADDVTLQPLPDLLPLTVLGPQALSRLRELGVRAPERSWGCWRAELFDCQLQLARSERLGAPAVTIWVSEGISAPVADDLVGAGFAPVGWSACEAARIERGLPLWGVDYSDANLPQELVAEEAISYDKGCYIGQEVVARLHYRGQPARLLRQLEVSPGLELPVGARLLHDAREVGTVTSSTAAHAERPGYGLALIKRAESGLDRLVLEDGAAVKVRVPPFASGVLSGSSEAE